MTLIAIFLAALIPVAPCLSKPIVEPLVLLGNIPSPPQGFLHNGPASNSTMISLRVSLVSSDVEGLQKKLYEVSTPGNSNYGKWLSKEEVESYITPTTDTLGAFNSFLSSNGVTAQNITAARDWWNLTIPVAKANHLFAAQYSSFTDQSSGKQVLRTLSYSIPASLHGHISLIHPTINFPQPGNKLSLARVHTQLGSVNSTKALASISCSEGITPSCLQALYKFPQAAAQSSPNNTLAVSGFLDQFAQTSDLKLFLSNFDSSVPPNTGFNVTTVDDGQNTQGRRDAGVEANLDIQYTVGVANGVDTTFVSVGDNFQDDDLEGDLDLINFFLSQSTVPSVVTTSYGRDEDTISRDLAIELCNAIMQLTSRGTSVLYASGDGGVSGGQTGDACTNFVPTFPSGCPYVTSVGATTGSTTETAAELSSGGFSNYFEVPQYQTTAVQNYLKGLGTTNSGLFNTSGRGFPDVSAQGQNLVIVNGGTAELVDGTSASSPIFASVIALANAQRLSEGKSVLGFLNPILYSNPNALNDITSGNNPGCGTDGFQATKGWDPITGLGTPNYEGLIAL